jgi:methyl-accepting chemotaxis protein
MTQVDHVTQRNAAAAEELSSTAEQMAAQAHTLLDLMEMFRGKGLNTMRPPKDHTDKPHETTYLSDSTPRPQPRLSANRDRVSAQRKMAEPSDADHFTKQTKWIDEL